MNNPFDEIINSFIKNNIGIDNNFLTASLSKNLKNNLLKLHKSNVFKTAGTGDNALVTYDKKFRGDEIYWLDRAHNDVYENLFFDLIDKFITHLNATCYTGIKEYEFHYTVYEVGTFYKKHVDQFKEKDSRKFSMIFYLNNNWVAKDGGELRIHQLNTSQDIAPENGKGVFFSSADLAHEVLLTTKVRLSITGWLKV